MCDDLAIFFAFDCFIKDQNNTVNMSERTLSGADKTLSTASAVRFKTYHVFEQKPACVLILPVLSPKVPCNTQFSCTYVIQYSSALLLLSNVVRRSSDSFFLFFILT